MPTPIQTLFPNATAGLGNGNLVQSAGTTPQVAYPTVAPVPGQLAPVLGPPAPVLATPVAAPKTTPIVSTSGLASQNVNNQMAVMNAAGPAPVVTLTPEQIAANAAGRTQLEKEAANMAQYGNQFGAGFDASGKPLPAGATPAGTLPPSATSTPTPTGGTTGGTTTPTTTTTTTPSADDLEQQNLDADNKARQAADQTKLDSMLNGTYALTPDQQAQIQGIKDDYARLVQQQELVNRNYQGAITQAGISAGRNIYAPEVESGNITAAINAGAQEVANLNSKMRSAIADAQTAITEGNLKAFDVAHNFYEDSVKKRQDALDRHYTRTQDALKAAADATKAKSEEAYRAAQIADLVNKPIRELTADALNHVQAVHSAFPDAGITENDTFTTMNAKVVASASYKSAQDLVQAQIAKDKASGVTTGLTPNQLFDNAMKLMTADPVKYAGNINGAINDAHTLSLGGTITNSNGVAPADQFIIDAANRLGQWNTSGQQAQLLKGISEKLKTGNRIGAVDDVFTGAAAGLQGTEKTQAFGRNTALANIDDIEVLLDEYKAAGGQTGLLTGSKEEILNKIRQTGDPALLGIASRITTTMAAYRKAISGAAFTKAEDALYKGAFPSSFGTEKYNAEKIDALRDQFTTEIKASLRTQLGNNADAIYDMVSTVRKEWKQDSTALKKQFPNADDNTINQILMESNAGKSSVGGDTLNESPQIINQKLTSIPTDVKWGEGTRKTAVGECGALVNDVAGVKVGDSLASKKAICDPSLTSNKVAVGDIFVQSVTNDPQDHGHTGLINSIGQDSKGKYAIVTEANYHLNGQTTHDRKLYLDDPKIEGFAKPKRLTVMA